MSQPDAPRFDAADLVGCLGHAVIATDLDGIVRWWNAAAEDLYGWPSEVAIGRNIATLTVPDISREVAEEIMDRLRAGRAWTGAFPVRNRAGEVFTALVTDTGLFRDGELVGIVGVSTNLGVALQPLLERSSDAALVLRGDALVTYASAAVTQLFGWYVHDVVGRSLLHHVHEDDRARLIEYLAAVTARPGVHAPLEVRIRRDSTWVWCEAALTNLMDDPVVRGVVCNLRVSLRRAAYEAAENRAGQLERALQTRVVIEQAKGFVACRAGVDVEEAFGRIRSYARGHRTSIHVVAAQIVAGRLQVP
jgi:PAS domain S-box-containing protein